MTRAAVSLTLVVCLLISMLAGVLNIQPARADIPITEGALNNASRPLSVPSSGFRTLAEPPETEWDETYGGASNDCAYCVVQTADGGYALAGYTRSFGAGGDDFWLVKTDSFGNYQWNKTFGGTDNDVAYSLVCTSDGGYALAGRTYSYGAGSSDLWVIKTDELGNAQWNKTYGGTDSDGAYALVETSDGGYAVAGYTKSFGVGLGDFWLVKTDAEGKHLWNTTYGGTGTDAANALTETSDGGYTIAGTKYVGFDNSDFWLVRTDSAGNMQWNKTYGATSADDRARALVKTSDGGYAIAGYVVVPYIYIGIRLVKTDSSGKMQWTHTYGGTHHDEGYALVQADDGGYAIAGITFDDAGYTDFWLVRTDASGYHLWNQTYGGASSDDAYALLKTSDGGYALAGFTASFGAGGRDFWLVKIGQPSPWPMFQHDPQHTGRSPHVGPSESPQATILLGNRTVNEFFGSPVISSDGTLYLRGPAQTEWGLCAYYPNGVQKWFSVSCNGDPPALSESTKAVYAHSDLEIFSVNMEDGSLRWQRSFAYIYSYLVAAENGILYFTALCHLPDDSYRNYLVGLNETGGEVLSYELGESSLTPSSPTVDREGTIYVGYNNTLFAVNPNGTERWRRAFEAVLEYHPPNPPTVTTPSIADDGTVYVVVNQESDGQNWADTWFYNHLHAIDPENPNEDKWTRKLRSNWPQNPVIDSVGNVYVTNWRYVVGSDGQSSLVAYSSQGDQIWAQDFAEYGFPGLLLVDTQSTVYVLRMSVYGSASLHIFDAEGNQTLVSLPFQEGHRQHHLSLDSDGTLYIGGHKNLYVVKSSAPAPPDEPPNCSIKLQKDGVEISEVDVWEFFDIYVGDSTDDIGIRQVRFSSDESQDNYPTGEWTQWYDWEITLGDWISTTKTKSWAFAAPGFKEVWAEVKDDFNETDRRLARIYVPGSLPPSCVVELQKSGVEVDSVDVGQAFDIYVGDSSDDAAIAQVMFSSDDLQDGYPTGQWTEWYDWNQNSGDWSAYSKTMKWSYAAGRRKEVWAMIKDSDGNVEWNHANMLVHPGYAIVVAGSGLWKMTLDHCANNAYRVLRNLGFNDDHIFYLNSQDQDVDGDGNSEVDGAALLSWFTYVMDEVKDKIDGDATPLILYFVGHGVPDAFVLDGSSDLYVVTLRDKLSEFSSETPMLIVINSCYSGSFITPTYLDQSVSAQNRIIITSTQNDQERKAFTWVRFSDRFWGSLGKASSVKDAFTSRATWGDNSHSWLDDNGDKVGHPPDDLGTDGNLASTTHIGVPGTESLDLEPWLFGWKRSPGELRVYDSQNRVTGLVNGEVKVEIPNSIYFEQDDFVIIFAPFDTYRYEVLSRETGAYGLDIGTVIGDEPVTFTAIDMPMPATAIHQYTIDWAALSHGEESVDVQVDSDGDGWFEHQFMSDAELNGSEFEQIIAYDVAILGISTVKGGSFPRQIVGEGKTLTINVTVQNQGQSAETFNVTIYANVTMIETREVTLTNGNAETISFTWGTTGFAKGNYTITATVTPIEGEIDTTDNTLGDCWVVVTIPGDVDGDFDVDLYDAVKLLTRYGAKQADPLYDPNCDIDNDGQIFLYDAVALLTHYGQKYP